MRLSRHTAHGRLARWFYALLHARHGVLLGAPLAAALITMLVYQAHPGSRVAEPQETQIRIVIERVGFLHRSYDQETYLGSPAPMTDPYVDDYSEFSPHGEWLEPVESGQKFDYNSSLALIYASGDGYVDLGAWATPLGVAVDSSGGVYVSDWSNSRVQVFNHGRVIWGSTFITTTTTLDGVITDYPQEMLYSSANTLMSQVVDTNPSAAYFSALDSYGSIDRRRLVQPIMMGVPAPQSGMGGTTLNEMVALFRRDRPIYVLAELDATTFQKEPAEPQRILFDPRVPISFVWNIKPLEEREQDLTVKLFLEGIPLNGTEPTRIPIYTNVVHTYVGVRMFSYGTPIALYATLYASLTFALGGLATWGVPRVYAGVVALYSRRQQRKKAARRAVGQFATAAHRYNRKTPGRRG